MHVDNPSLKTTVCHLFSDMSTSEQPTTQSLTPDQIPFTTPLVMRSYVTDTGKILPRKYTHLSAKHQRAITKTIKHSRNMLLAQ
jgi:small subunit ribosomal protein S18